MGMGSVSSKCLTSFAFPDSKMSFLARTSVRLATVGLRSVQQSSSRAALVAPMQLSMQDQARGMASFKEMYFGLRGFNQYGLYEDDILNPTATVNKALLRLSPDELDARNYRIARAFQLAVEKTVLPKDQWVSYDDDVKHGKYLQPHIEEVMKEQAEKDAWNRL